MKSIRIIALVALAGCFDSRSPPAAPAAAARSPPPPGFGVPEGVQTPATESLTGGKRGGTLKVLNNEDFEHLDPGQTYFSIDYEVMYATPAAAVHVQAEHVQGNDAGHG